MDLKVKSVEVLMRHGHVDTIFLVLDYDVLAFPAIGEQGVAEIEVQQDHGVNFCKKNFGIDPSIIRGE